MLLAPRRWRHGDLYEFEASLGYIMSSRLAKPKRERSKSWRDSSGYELLVVLGGCNSHAGEAEMVRSLGLAQQPRTPGTFQVSETSHKEERVGAQGRTPKAVL